MVAGADRAEVDEVAAAVALPFDQMVLFAGVEGDGAAGEDARAVHHS